MLIAVEILTDEQFGTVACLRHERSHSETPVSLDRPIEPTTLVLPLAQGSQITLKRGPQTHIHNLVTDIVPKND